MIKLVFLLLTVGAAAGCNSDVLGAGTPSNPATEAFAPSLNVDISSFARTESGVYYKDIRVGTGDEAAAADQVTITYAGYLKDGKLFDSESTPTQFSLAVFIQGFRDGIVGMRAGGVRKLVIPSALAYGWQGRPDDPVPIPRNATLVFDVELFVVTKPATTTP
ncbi:MAG: FKBP-type peptidyl-prolyl cis-trans isomerase [Gemmatimonadota bacterium]|nr:FKBP-type peptidyl-prolyl cis-trans isomerase [Gemmatimonadota bacterium]